MQRQQHVYMGGVLAFLPLVRTQQAASSSCPMSRPPGTARLHTPRPRDPPRRHPGSEKDKNMVRSTFCMTHAQVKRSMDRIAQSAVTRSNMNTTNQDGMCRNSGKKYLPTTQYIEHNNETWNNCQFFHRTLYGSGLSVAQFSSFSVASHT